MEYGAELGARYAQLIGDDDDWARMTDNYARFCEIAASFGLVAAIEAPVNSRKVNSVPLALKLIADAGRETPRLSSTHCSSFVQARTRGALGRRADLPVHTIQRWPTRWPAMRTRHRRRAAPRYPRCSAGWSADQRGMVPAARHDTVAHGLGGQGTLKHAALPRRALFPRRGGKATNLSEPSRTRADDPFGGRHPTSHERLTGLPWDASYHDGPAPWELARSQPSCVWRPKADSPERCSMRAAGPARTRFTSPRWDCRFWASTWLRRHWRSLERRPPTVGSRSSSLRLTRSSWSVWGARLRRCWTAECSTPSTATSDPIRGESRVGDRARWNPVCVVLQ